MDTTFKDKDWFKLSHMILKIIHSLLIQTFLRGSADHQEAVAVGWK